jgi:hypothetical protein
MDWLWGNKAPKPLSKAPELVGKAQGDSLKFVFDNVEYEWPTLFEEADEMLLCKCFKRSDLYYPLERLEKGSIASKNVQQFLPLALRHDNTYCPLTRY